MTPIKRIVWLCTFSNPEKRSHMRFWRKMCGEVGQWIPNLLKAFKRDSSIELHIITFDWWMRDRYRTWSADGVTYHCFQPDFWPLGYNARIPFEEWTDFRINRWRVNRLLKELKPDLVHLFGCENPRYATAVLDLPRETPCVCTIQGFATRELPHRNTYINRVRSKFEKRIMVHLKYFLGDYDSELVVRGLNSGAIYNHMYFPVNDDLIDKTEPQEIKYDTLFAGAQTRAKGFGDFLAVCAYCAGKKQDFKAAVVGSKEAYPGTIGFVVENHLEANIDFLDWFPSQSGLFKAYRQSRTFLAPTYNDAFPSTIRENMLLGTPCIAYKTGGISYANDEGNENIVIVEQGDWSAMAEKVLHYASHEKERHVLAARARAYAAKTFSLDANVGAIKSMYEQMLREGVYVL